MDDAKSKKKKKKKPGGGKNDQKMYSTFLHFNFYHNLTMVRCLAYVPAFNNSALGLNNSILI